MREIKFRLRIKEKNGEITITYCSLDDFCEDYGLSEALSIVDVISKNEFTGLLDKNGKEIFEGDIYKMPPFDTSEKNHIVEWERSGYGLPNENCIEVIGNIYENKDLLTKE